MNIGGMGGIIPGGGGNPPGGGGKNPGGGSGGIWPWFIPGGAGGENAPRGSSGPWPGGGCGYIGDNSVSVVAIMIDRREVCYQSG